MPNVPLHARGAGDGWSGLAGRSLGVRSRSSECLLQRKEGTLLHRQQPYRPGWKLHQWALCGCSQGGKDHYPCRVDRWCCRGRWSGRLDGSLGVQLGALPSCMLGRPFRQPHRQPLGRLAGWRRAVDRGGEHCPSSESLGRGRGAVVRVRRHSVRLSWQADRARRRRGERARSERRQEGSERRVRRSSPTGGGSNIRCLARSSLSDGRGGRGEG
eukprot:scaffold221131_cov31-Tisochrysis_lutea.AAC.4